MAEKNALAVSFFFLYICFLGFSQDYHKKYEKKSYCEEEKAGGMLKT